MAEVRVTKSGEPDKRYTKGGRYVGQSIRNVLVTDEPRRYGARSGHGKWVDKPPIRAHYNLTIDWEARSIQGMGIDALTERIHSILVNRLGTFGGDVVKLKLKGVKSADAM